MFISNEQEAYRFFDQHIEHNGSYFILHPETGNEQLIYVAKFKNFNEDGSHYFLEYPCYLVSHPFRTDDLLPIEDTDEDGDYCFFPLKYHYIREPFTYEIDSPQTGPFLPESYFIEFITESDSVAANYLFLLNQLNKN